ncbi:hypothetical protein GJ496_002367 [Pomphorhynchus laevis]|nr:hypothetical protein GJ496_002367 [Pomphorhynchus laevis]
MIINKFGSLLYCIDEPHTSQAQRDTITFKNSNEPPIISAGVFGRSFPCIQVKLDSNDVNRLDSTNSAQILSVNDKLLRTMDGDLGDSHGFVQDFVKNPDHYPLILTVCRSALADDEQLILSGLLHTITAINDKLPRINAPDDKQDAYILQIKSLTTKVDVLTSPTGIKFVAISDKESPNSCAHFLKQAYIIYSDVVLKNPYYNLNQPIRCDRFTASLRELMSKPEATPFSETPQFYLFLSALLLLALLLLFLIRLLLHVDCCY